MRLTAALKLQANRTRRVEGALVAPTLNIAAVAACETCSRTLSSLVPAARGTLPTVSDSPPNVSHTSHTPTNTHSSSRSVSLPVPLGAQLPRRTTMDIDDLLAEVAVDSTPQESRDLQDLTRAWVAERTAPEILNWPEELMDRVLDRIRRQVCWACCSSGCCEEG